MTGRQPRGSRGRRLGLWLVLAPPFASCVAAGCASPPRPPCVEQSNEALEEIASGRAEAFVPALAAWEREQAKACGWVLPEDFEGPAGPGEAMSSPDPGPAFPDREPNPSACGWHDTIFADCYDHCTGKYLCSRPDPD